MRSFIPIPASDAGWLPAMLDGLPAAIKPRGGRHDQVAVLVHAHGVAPLVPESEAEFREGGQRCRTYGPRAKGSTRIFSMHSTIGLQCDVGGTCERQSPPGGKTATKSQMIMPGEGGDSPAGTSHVFPCAAIMELESDLLSSQYCTALGSDTRDRTDDVGGPRSETITGSQTTKARSC